MVVRRLALLAIALAALMLPATPAAGASYPTRVIVSLKYPAFHGKLQSRKGACAKRRTVKLFRKRPGRDRLLGVDKSSAKGRWAILIGNRLPSGASYYAKAPAKGKCKPDKSKVLTIG